MHSSNTRCVKSILVSSLHIESSARQTVDGAVVSEYADAMAACRQFPPILVYEDPQGELWLVDGLHRVRALQSLAQTTTTAEVRQGSLNDAIWESCAVNKGHGLRRSNADKRCSVTRALLLPKGRRLSDRQIATHCGVCHHTVGRIRALLESSGDLRQMQQRVAIRGGASYLLDVSAVSEANKKRTRLERDSTVCDQATPSAVADASADVSADIMPLLASVDRAQQKRESTAAVEVCPTGQLLDGGSALKRPRPPSAPEWIVRAGALLTQATACVEVLQRQAASSDERLDESSVALSRLQRHMDLLRQTLVEAARAFRATGQGAAHLRSSLNDAASASNAELTSLGAADA
jgi:hypothetical protein